MADLNLNARRHAMDEILRGQYASETAGARTPGRLRLLTWNIERGLQLPRVMEFIGGIEPDVCLLQEVDLNARRTGRRNVAEEVAKRFEFNYVFGFTWEELSQGSETNRAYQGQAVLARFPIERPRVLRFHRQTDAWRPRWYAPRWPAFQPRRGGRMALAAEIVLGGARLAVYNLHLESREEDDLRLWQLSEVVEDARRYPAGAPVVAAGDMNTRDLPTPLRHHMIAAGFQDACDGPHCRVTKRNGDTLDWIFTRGPVSASGTKAHHDVKASDHYPVSTDLFLR